jgi:hypothetical protein
MKCVWNNLKSRGVFIGWGIKIDFLGFFGIFGALTVKKQIVFQFKQSNFYSNDQI